MREQHTVRVHACLLAVLISTGAVGNGVRTPTAVAESPMVTAVRVNATGYDGDCSGTVSFTARIECSGPGTVRYQWITDDGEEGMVGTLTFDRAGTATVYMSIQGVVNEGRNHRKGWGALRVVAPNRMESNRAFYTANCGMASGGSKHIDVDDFFSQQPNHER